jgi:hypothetical protein
MSLDQTFPQAAPHAKPGFDACHPAGVALVIIAKKMQQSVERQDSELRLQRVSGSTRLPARDTRGNHDIPEVARTVSRKRQHVRCTEFAPVTVIQRPDPGI